MSMDILNTIHAMVKVCYVDMINVFQDIVQVSLDMINVPCARKKFPQDRVNAPMI
jgi:hypothetical protein